MTARAKQRIGHLAGVALLALLPTFALATVARAQSDEFGQPTEWLGVGAGGLRFDLKEDVFLESQVIHLSLDQVRVRYRLVNGSTEPSLLTVGFPFPSLPEPQPPAPSLAMAFNDASLKVDGEVEPIHSVGARIYNDGHDVTAYLEAAGIDTAQLTDGALVHLSRSEHRRLERALTDRGEPRPSRYDWSLAVEPRWRVSLAPRQATDLELTYTPYPGLSVDRFSGQDRLTDLAHLEAYCADEQPELLAWMQKAIADRLETSEDAPRFAEIKRHELSYRWEELSEGRQERALRIEARNGGTVPKDARIAFCFPGGVAALPDGTHLAGGFGRPEDDRLDVIIIE